MDIAKGSGDGFDFLFALLERNEYARSELRFRDSVVEANLVIQILDPPLRDLPAVRRLFRAAEVSFCKLHQIVLELLCKFHLVRGK
jgi:hypothetical protein